MSFNATLDIITPYGFLHLLQPNYQSFVMVVKAEGKNPSMRNKNQLKRELCKMMELMYCHQDILFYTRYLVA